MLRQRQAEPVFTGTEICRFRSDLRKWGENADAAAYFRLVKLLTEEKVEEAVFLWALQRMGDPEDIEYADKVWEETDQRAVDAEGLRGCWERWGGKAHPEIWLRLKLKGKLSDYWKGKRRRPPPDEPLERFNPQTGEWEPLDVAHLATPETIVLCREQARAVRAWVEKLPCALREVVKLFIFEGMSQGEIGQRLRVTRETVNHRWQRACTALRESYNQAASGKEVK